MTDMAPTTPTVPVSPSGPGDYDYETGFVAAMGAAWGAAADLSELNGSKAPWGERHEVAWGAMAAAANTAERLAAEYVPGRLGEVESLRHWMARMADKFARRAELAGAVCADG